MNLDMTNLDISNERDFATYMALRSNNQGKNREVALEKFKMKLGNFSISEFCQIQLESTDG